MKSRKKKSKKKGKGPTKSDLLEAIEKMKEMKLSKFTRDRSIKNIIRTYKKTRPELRKRRNINTYKTLSKTYSKLPEDIQRLVSKKVSAIPILEKENSLLLLEGAKEGNLAKVKYALDNYANIETRDIGGWTPLIWASYLGHSDVVRFLLDAGANKEAKSKNDNTPLHMASKSGHTAVRLPTGRRASGFIFFSRTMRDDTKAQLAEKNPGETIKNSDVIREIGRMWVALPENEKMLWGFMANNEFKYNIDTTGVVKLLIDAGANINAKDKDKLTPLHWVSKWGHPDVVEQLLDAGANIEAKDNWGNTPLIWASWNGHPYVVRFLLEKGADTEAKTENGNTPLLLASQKGHEEIVKLLENYTPPTSASGKKKKKKRPKSTKKKRRH